MKCSRCGRDSAYRVVDTKSDDSHVYRRRVCSYCGHVIYTTETESESSRYNLSRVRSSLYKS